MGSGVSFNIDDYPLEERKAVLEEKVSLEGIAEYIKAGKAKKHRCGDGGWGICECWYS